MAGIGSRASPPGPRGRPTGGLPPQGRLARSGPSKGRRPGPGRVRWRRKEAAMVTLGKTDGAVRRTAFGGIAAGLVIGLAACGSVAAGAGSPAIANPAVGKPSKATSPAGQINPGGPVIRASKHVLLCMEIPKLTRMTVTRTPWPPLHHAREVLPTGFTIRNAA